MKKTTKILLVVLLLIELAAQLYLSSADSQTTDEAVHVSAGYTYWTKGDYRFNPEHPPLVKLLSALPLVFMDLKTPDDAIYWSKSGDFFYDNWRENRAYGEDFFYALGNNAKAMVFWSRLASVLITLVLGLMIFLLANKFYGEKIGLLALFVYVFNPTILAHGHLVTTDIAVSLGFILTLYSLYLMQKNKSWKYVIFMSLSLAVAFLSKFTAVILVPCIAAQLIYWLIAKKIKWREFWLLCLKIVCSALLLILIIFSVYGFDFRPAGDMSALKQQIINQNPAVDRALVDKIDSFGSIKNVLVPKDFFKGMVLVLGHTRAGHDSYLLGQTSRTGWWYYFPVVFTAKNSLFLLILIPPAIFYVFRKKDKTGFASMLLIFSAVYFLSAMTSKADLGIRHILPIFPLIFILISRLFIGSKKRYSHFLYIMFAAILLEVIIAFPFYISYFNQAFGWQKNGYKIASDSNADWGQDLVRIKKFIDSNKDEINHCENLFMDYGWDGKDSLNYYGIHGIAADNLSCQSKGCLITGSTSYVDPKNSWLWERGIEQRITPSTFFIKLN